MPVFLRLLYPSSNKYAHYKHNYSVSLLQYFNNAECVPNYSLLGSRSSVPVYQVTKTQQALCYFTSRNLPLPQHNWSKQLLTSLNLPNDDRRGTGSSDNFSLLCVNRQSPNRRVTVVCLKRFDTLADFDVPQFHNPTGVTATQARHSMLKCCILQLLAVTKKC